MSRKQIKEEQIDAALAELKRSWVSAMTESDVIPAGGLCASCHEIAGMSHQRDHAVQASLRIGDKQRMEDALMAQAVAAMHGWSSLNDAHEANF